MKTKNLLFFVVAVLAILTIAAVPCFAGNPWVSSDKTIVVKPQGEVAVVVYYGEGSGGGFCTQGEFNGDIVFFKTNVDVVAVNVKTGEVKRSADYRFKAPTYY